jgi:hypothetical protein
MKPNAIATLILLALFASTPVLGQATAPDTGVSSPGAPGANGAPKEPMRASAPADEDARKCLEFATNLEIIQCAEKYRAHARKR